MPDTQTHNPNVVMTDETKLYKGVTLYRVKALDSYRPYVRAGLKGGWIEKPKNLADNAWVGNNGIICGDAQAANDATVSDNAIVSDRALVTNNAKIRGGAKVTDSARVSGHSIIRDTAQISDRAHITGYVSVGQNAQVMGYASLDGNVRVWGSTKIFQKVYLDGRTVLFGDGSIAAYHHILDIKTYCSRQLTLVRGQREPLVSINFWLGSIPEFKTHIAGNTWPWDHDSEECEKLRPEFEAIAALCESRAALWEKERTEKNAKK